MSVLCLHLNFLVLMTMFSSTRSPATTATSTTTSVTRLTSAHILPRCHREGVCVTIYFCDYDYVTKRCHIGIDTAAGGDYVTIRSTFV